MTHERIIPVDNLSYHQQETEEWCGAACAQMVLHALSMHTPPLDQDWLRQEIENRATAPEPGMTWLAPPDGLEAMLNAVAPPPPGGQFRLFAAHSAAEITRLIAWHIEQHGVPAIALVYGLKHWVIVRGYTSDAPPAGPNDPNFNVLSLDLYDPWPALPAYPPVAAGVPPPHIDEHDGCATRNTVLNNVSYAGWTASGGALHTGYMRGVPQTATGSKWKGLFLAICDPSGEKDQYDRSDDDDEGNGGDNIPQPAAQPAGIIDEKQALEKAWEALHEYGLDSRKEWQAALQGVTPGVPLRVGMAAGAEPTYYIVPFVAHGNVPLAVRVDAHTGAYLQAVAAIGPGHDVVTILSGKEVLDGLLGREITFRDGRSILLHSGNVNPIPSLVWRPGLQSFSPFHPFYEFNVRTPAQDYLLYVRARDGSAFTELDDNVAGA